MNRTLQILRSIIRGNFLTEIGADRNIPFILYIFVLVTAYITLNLFVEQSMTRKEENERIIENLKIDYTHKYLDLMSLDTRTNIDVLLGKKGSRLEPPCEAPKKIGE